MQITLPDENGRKSAYTLSGTPVEAQPIEEPTHRIFLAAAHVVANPYSAGDPSSTSDIDWLATMAFRRHLAELGLGIAEAMDTAQRGTGLDWISALKLISRTREELPDAVVFNGAGTDQLELGAATCLDDIVSAYLDQIERIQGIGGRIIVMASRELARLAKSPDDYAYVYAKVLRSCDQPAIIHWLGEMFDPHLEGYWSSSTIEEAMETAITVISENASTVDGIKLSLLDKNKEITMRRRLPVNVRMYTGDDFNYPELIAGDEQGFSHALLGILDPIAPAASTAANLLARGDTAGFNRLLEPTVPLSRHIFQSPTRFYKTGVVFLSWLNGFQDHFTMIGGAQSMRSLPHLVGCFKLADQARLLRDPELAIDRMKRLLAVYGA